MPQPKSTDLKLLAGTYRADRAKKKNTPARGLPSCPKELSDDAKKEWKRVAKLLDEAGLLSRLDQTALSAYATAWDLWRKTQEQLRDDDLLLQAGNGLQYANPLLGIAHKAKSELLAWTKELGLSPASRQRLPAVAPQPIGKLSKYLKNGNEGRKRPLFGDDEERAKEIRFFGDAG